MSENRNQIQIKIVRDVNSLPQEWDDYVGRHAHATIFHTGNWQRLLGKTYSYQFIGVHAVNGEGTIVGVLPAWLVSSALTGKRLVTCPYSYICDPLADNDEICKLLVDEAVKLRESLKASYYEMKCLLPVSAAEHRFTKSGQFETYHLDLRPSQEELWAGLHKSIIQRGVNKAQKEGVTIVVADNESYISKFHHLNLLTCRKHGIPAQPLRFHQAVWNDLASQGRADFLFAYHAGQAIASVVIFYFNGTATYMYGASDETYLNLRPNHLLLWEAILLAKKKGMTTFDLGRVSDDNPGLKEFKQRWGAKTVPLNYYYWPEKKGVGAVNRKSLKFKVVTLMFSRMPLVVTSRLTWLYKHLA